MDRNITKINKVTQRMLEIDFVLPGTLRVVYQKCGTATCKCASGQAKDKHGPYTYWDRKIKGVSVTSSVSKKQKVFILKGIKNRKKFELYFQKILELSQKLPDNL